MKIYAAAFILASFLLPFAAADYPVITSLSNDDLLFRQLEGEIEDYYARSKKKPPESANPTIYAYKPEKKADIYAIAARANIPYDTLATLNRIRDLTGFKALTTVLIPSVPGIFVPLNPENDLEQIMCSWRLDQGEPFTRIVVNIGGNKQAFAFFEGKRFRSIERAFFLKIFFRFPLPFGKISSGFGTRVSPFTGHAEAHNGIDIAAPKGTDVYAVREGCVTATGSDEIYGKFILITHPGGYQSFYGHLDSVLVAAGQNVGYSIKIGEIGTTGRTTGPHLHFEIRKKGVPVDPENLIKN